MSSLPDQNPLANAGSLDDFKPRAKVTPNSTDLSTVRTEKVVMRQVAQDRGFTIDNLATVVRAKRSGAGKTSKSHTLRLYVNDINRFQTWCNENDYSQARGFELILDKLLTGE